MNTKSVFDRIARSVSGSSFAIEFWDGERRKYGTEREAFTLILKDERRCRRLFANLTVRFGEAYCAGAIDVRGSLRELIRAFYSLSPTQVRLTPFERLKILFIALRQRNTRSQARSNIAHHYNLGNEFYSLWLDKSMVYSCAYFRALSDDIETAQRQKLGHICKKLLLAEGDTILDIGCGWGALIIYAAREWGVRAHGITLSEAQKIEGDRRIAAAGVSNRARIEVEDYRHLSDGTEYDRVVSVGMFEHVGRANIGNYFHHTARLLKEGGIGVLHTIGRMDEAAPNPWYRKYIFPGVYFPSLPEIVEQMAKHGLTVIDVESLRQHYFLTLKLWIDAFNRNTEDVRSMYGWSFVRMWRLYLETALVSFFDGPMNVWQIQFCKGKDARVPLTRDYTC